ncbi:MAG: N-acetylmuramoyl-L-alanine amidase-like domain-containing protein [Draconibacterium sp.]
MNAFRYLITLSGFLWMSSLMQLEAQVPVQAVYEPRDKEIVENLLEKFSAESKTPTGDLIIKIGRELLGTTYVAHTLEKEPEQLIVNLRELDCTTFAENCLAIAKTIKSEKPGFNEYIKILQNIRYRNGVINGYPSRVHYFSDWMFENSRNGFLREVSKEIAGTRYLKIVNYMSTHPDSYTQLKNVAFLPLIIRQEKEISAREMYYIPEEKIAELENKFENGDIAGITTGIAGVDILHAVILLRVNGRIHLLHAPQSGGKVLISDETLEDYLKNSKSANGIMVTRPL